MLSRSRTGAHVPLHGILSANDSVIQWRQNTSVPFGPEARRARRESNMTLHAVASQGSLNVWQIASVPLDANVLSDARPMLFNASSESEADSEPGRNPYVRIPLGTTVDLVVQNKALSIVGGPNSPHPFHLHSRRFWVIGKGAGEFGFDNVSQAMQAGVRFELDNPPLRDGFGTDPNSWVVIRYTVDHPAANGTFTFPPPLRSGH